MRLPVVDSFVVRGNIKEDLNDQCQELNEKYNITPLVNVLGEHYSLRKKCIEDREKYLHIIDTLEDIEISVKPTQLGLDVDTHAEVFFKSQYQRIVDKASNQNVFVWLDMESSEYISSTIDAYLEILEDYDNIGICLQANMRRTEEDLDQILEAGGKVRLVKGAYNESSDIAYTKSQKIDEKYKEYIKRYSNTLNAFDGELALGTHDKNMITYAFEQINEPEIQMLMGVRDNYQKQLATKCKVSRYIPYGDNWIPYFYRRIREDKSNLIVGLRNLF